jgi:SAM-dependent methyltransferase
MSTTLALARGARASPSPGARTRERLEEARYVAFEERIRGSSEEIRGTLSDYVPYFRGSAPVVDLGCGRGEFLELLREAGIDGLGIDGNAEMVGRCRERGLSAEVGDVIDFVARRAGVIRASSPLSSWSTFPRVSWAISRAATAPFVPGAVWCSRREPAESRRSGRGLLSRPLARETAPSRDAGFRPAGGGLSRGGAPLLEPGSRESASPCR